MNIYDKLTCLQGSLKAPKNQFNKFGGYHYRSLEDITEAAKPLMDKLRLSLVISDTPVMIGDRFYIKAEAILYDAENPEEAISATAFAREPQTKKGMDEAQITGATSSYARKYCLNGLFAIDDCKDADTMPPAENGNGNGKPITSAQLKQIADKAHALGVDVPKFCSYMKVGTLEQIQAADFNRAMATLDLKNGNGGSK